MSVDHVVTSLFIPRILSKNLEDCFAVSSDENKNSALISLANDLYWKIAGPERFIQDKVESEATSVVTKSHTPLSQTKEITFKDSSDYETKHAVKKNPFEQKLEPIVEYTEEEITDICIRVERLSSKYLVPKIDDSVMKEFESFRTKSHFTSLEDAVNYLRELKFLKSKDMNSYLFSSDDDFLQVVFFDQRGDIEGLAAAAFYSHEKSYLGNKQMWSRVGFGFSPVFDPKEATSIAKINLADKLYECSEGRLEKENFNSEKVDLNLNVDQCLSLDLPDINTKEQIRKKLGFLSNLNGGIFFKALKQGKPQFMNQADLTKSTHQFVDIYAISPFKCTEPPICLKPFPILESYRNILETIHLNDVTIIHGPTGCGKSTQIPQYILANYHTCISKSSQMIQAPQILVVQPRRLATISVCKYVKKEVMNSSWVPRLSSGTNPVGYAVRFDNDLPQNTNQSGSITFVTPGVLLQMILNGDPSLPGYSHIILDEIHERSLELDTIMYFLREVLSAEKIVDKKRTKRINPLKLICMSASADTQEFMNYFKDYSAISTSFTAPINGNEYAVKVLHIEDVCNLLSLSDNQQQVFDSETLLYLSKSLGYAKYAPDLQSSNEDVAISDGDLRKIPSNLIVNLVANLLLTPENIQNNQNYAKELMPILDKGGSVLIFLPTWLDICKLEDAFKAFKLNDQHPFNETQKFSIWRLYSKLDASNYQSKLSKRDNFDHAGLFESTPDGITRIILSTNIAESSITLPDVSVVIDTCTQTTFRWNPIYRSTFIFSTYVSQANIKQRAGRTGRLGPGIYINLLSKKTLSEKRNIISQNPVPEILKTNLDKNLLLVLWLQESLSLYYGKSYEKPYNLNAEMYDKFITNPTFEQVDSALNSLSISGCISADGSISSMGKMIARIPLSINLAKMVIISSFFNCVSPIIAFAAAWSTVSKFGKDIVTKNFKENFEAINSDHLSLGLQIMSLIYKDSAPDKQSNSIISSSEEFNGFVEETTKVTLQITKSLIELQCLNDRSNSNSENIEIVKFIIANGFFPNVGILSSNESGAERRNVRNNSVYQTKTLSKLICTTNLEKSLNIVTFDSIFEFTGKKIGYTSGITQIHPMALILLQSTPEQIKSKEDETDIFGDKIDGVILDEWIRFKIPSVTKNEIFFLHQMRDFYQTWIAYKADIQQYRLISNNPNDDCLFGAILKSKDLQIKIDHTMQEIITDLLGTRVNK